MKKYGKFLKRPEKAPEKKSTGDGLLQSYFTSLLSLVLSVSMFFGTTYAWFTSEVNNVGNEIYIGTLDVELEKQAADGTWKSLSELSNGVNTTKLFDGQIRWEPGYTMLETVRVINEGDLAFNYELCFTDGELGKDSLASIEDIAEHFDVWVYDHLNKEAPDPKSYTDISKENGWEYAGTLDKLLAGNAVLDGVMVTVRQEGLESTEINEGTTDGVATMDTYTIALHMREEAGGKELMGQKISLNVRLIAYQRTSESDAFDEPYDQVTAVGNAEELVNALAAGGNVVLTNDIDLGEKQIVIPADKTAILELNGHTISQTKEQTEGYSMIVNRGTLTISDNVGTGKITYADASEYSADTGYASNTIRNEGVLNVLGGTIENTSSDNVKEYGYPHAIDAYQGSVTNISGGTVKSKNYDAIRMFCNSVTEATTVNISGGEIINRVTFKNPAADVAGYGILKITGGEFTTANGVTANIRLLNFSTDYSKMKATISGGTFDKGVKIQNYAKDVEPQMNDWLTVTGLELTAPTEEGDTVWKIAVITD